MTAFWRRAAVLLCAMLLALVPVLADPGGDGGWINLPGGGQGNSSSLGKVPQMEAVRDLGASVRLRLDAGMRGAIAVISSGHGATVAMTSPNGRFVLPGADVLAAAKAGVRRLDVFFVTTTGLTLDVVISIDPAKGSVRITAY